jgi:hypothetical protein
MATLQKKLLSPEWAERLLSWRHSGYQRNLASANTPTYHGQRWDGVILKLERSFSQRNGKAICHIQKESSFSRWAASIPLKLEVDALHHARMIIRAVDRYEKNTDGC